jgi:16S rRNA (uracil1498-N3)-methyltransferase
LPQTPRQYWSFALMRTPRFYFNHPLPREAGATLSLRGAPAQHMNVLRMAAGDMLALFDGLGGECAATLLSVGKREVSVRIERHEDIERESTLDIVLAQALATGEKMDAIVQKATELGVVAIQPLATARATVKLSAERAAQRRTHWQGVAIAACEQCGRNRVPEIRPVMDFITWLAMPTDRRRVLLHPQGDAALAALATALALDIAIGPEGGFSDDETARAKAAGIACVRAGSRVLRTETAGPAILAALNALSGDFK